MAIFNFDGIPEEEKTEFLDRLEKYSGLAPEKLESFVPEDEFASLQQKLTDQTGQLSELQGKLQQFQVEDPFGKQILELVTSGAKETDLSEFLRMRSMDPENMSERDLLIEDYIQRGSSRTDAEILAAADLRSTKDDEGEEVKEELAKLRLRTNDIRKRLNDVKSKASIPDSVVQTQKQKQELQERLGEYKTTIPAMVSTLTTINVDLGLEGVANEFKLNLDNKAMGEIAESAMQFGLAQGLPANDPKIAEHMSRAMWYLNGPEILKLVSKEIEAKVVARISNAAPPPTPGIKPEVPASKEFEEWRSKNVKSGEF